MQGYIQVSSFDVPTHESQPFNTLNQTATQDATAVASAITEPQEDMPNMTPKTEQTVSVEYIIISRRSKDRAGLRYQRRGIDDEARVANFVETEAIMQVLVLLLPA